MLLQELPTKMVRQVIKSVNWEFYYLTNGARIVLLRKIRSLIARLGR